MRFLLWYAVCNSAFETPVGLSHLGSTPGSSKVDDIATKFILTYLSFVLLSQQELSREILSFIYWNFGSISYNSSVTILIQKKHYFINRKICSQKWV